jgi:4-hydroxy-tetrahydrodipicolinate reductase
MAAATGNKEHRSKAHSDVHGRSSADSAQQKTDSAEFRKKTVVNVCVVGAAGRMGKEIINQIEMLDTVRLSGAIVSQHSMFINQAVHVGQNCSSIHFSDDLKEYATMSDVILDFSKASATNNVINTALLLKKPVVCGVTEISPETENLIKKASSSIPILYSPNMSIGISAISKAVEMLSKILDFDIEINEIHHAEKRDIPSGTALLLGKIMAKARNWSPSNTLFFRTHDSGQRSHQQIGISSMRGGSNAGAHTIYFLGAGESIEITHRVESRAIFAKGAIAAAKWLYTKKNGLYSMTDLLTDKLQCML